MSTPTTAEPPAGAIVKNAKDIVLELGKLIQAEGSPERLEELLGLCDRLNLLLANMPSARPSKLQLQGLGMKLGNASILNGNGANGNGLFANGNGHATRSESPDQSHDDKENPSSKIDKGKGKAEPEPEQHEPVLSPRHFLVGESEDEDEADDPIVDPDGVGFDGEKFPDSRRGALLKNDSRQLKCGECGETSRVAPPKGYRFAKNLAGETEGGTGSKKVRWACGSCGEVNRGRVIANRASASEAIAAFRSRYSAEPHTPDASLDAVSTFRESYGMNNDLAHWKQCVAKHGG